MAICDSTDVFHRHGAFRHVVCTIFLVHLVLCCVPTYANDDPIIKLTELLQSSGFDPAIFANSGLDNLASSLKNVNPAKLNLETLNKAIADVMPMADSAEGPVRINHKVFGNLINSFASTMGANISQQTTESLSTLMNSLFNMFKWMPGMQKVLHPGPSTIRVHRKILTERLGEKARKGFIEQTRKALGNELDDDLVESSMYYIQKIVDIMVHNTNSSPKELLAKITEAISTEMDEDTSVDFKEQLEKYSGLFDTLLDPAKLFRLPEDKAEEL